MQFSWQRPVVIVSMAMVSIWAAGDASAQSTTATQVLDRVNTVSPKAVLDMAFDDPAAASPFEAPPEITTDRGFTACQLTAKRGLYCLDQNLNGAPGRFVRRWDPVFKDSEVGNPYFSCEDLPGVDTSKNAETCTGITADDNGSVVVAGKRKGGYNLIKVAAKADLPNQSCSAPWAPLSSTDLCYKILLPRDRPLLVDVTYAELTFAGNVKCTGIIGLENRTTLMFFADKDSSKNDAACATDYAEKVIVGTRDWGLQKGEILQAATTLKTANGDSFALVISNYGRVLAEKTSDTAVAPFPVAISRVRRDAGGSVVSRTDYGSVAALRDARTATDGTPASSCDANPQKFGIRTSTKSGRLYVTDRNYCEASAFEPLGDTLVSGSTLATSAGLQVAVFGGWDLVLSTTTQPSGPSYPSLEPTLAPGISIDLSKCASADGCTLVAAGNGQRVAALSNVNVVSKSKGMILFQVRNLPDCRWMPNPPPACSGAISGGSTPQTQYLNIKPLLPKEVTDQYPLDSLPDMYISPQYRAQLQNGFYFEAFFGVPQSGVVFQDVFNLEFFVADLTATRKELGCVASPPLRTSVADLLKWDITVTVSEKVKVIGAQVAGSPGHYDVLVNNGCGSTAGGGSRWSAYPYNLELTPDVYHAGIGDDYFAHLVVDLFRDLEDARAQTACQAGGPLASLQAGAVCSSLQSTWVNAKDKLAKCLKGSNYPKTSEAVRNCNSFDSQMANYRGILNLVPVCTDSTTCSDKDNRLGELKARTDTIRHVTNDRLIPSVPANGFEHPVFEGIDENGNWVDLPTP